MTGPNEDLRKLTDDAFEALWNVITKRYPEAEYGDLSPLLGVKELLHEYMEPLLRRFLLDPCAPVAAVPFLHRG
jgi:hypothetical protein